MARRPARLDGANNGWRFFLKPAGLAWRACSRICICFHGAPHGPAYDRHAGMVLNMLFANRALLQHNRICEQRSGLHACPARAAARSGFGSAGIWPGC